MQNIINRDEKNYVNALRAKINEAVSPLIDSFSGWLIGGFGAASALLVSNYDAVSKHIDIGGIQEFLYLLMAAFVVAIIQKFTSSIVLANAKGSLAAIEQTEKALSKSVNLDIKIILSELEVSMLPISRWAVRRSFKKALSGDLVSSSRWFTRLCQIQGIFTLIQSIITLVAIYQLARGFHA